MHFSQSLNLKSLGEKRRREDREPTVGTLDWSQISHKVIEYPWLSSNPSTKMMKAFFALLCVISSVAAFTRPCK